MLTIGCVEARVCIAKQFAECSHILNTEQALWFQSLLSGKALKLVTLFRALTNSKGSELALTMCDCKGPFVAKSAGLMMITMSTPWTLHSKCSLFGLVRSHVLATWHRDLNFCAHTISNGWCFELEFSTALVHQKHSISWFCVTNVLMTEVMCFASLCSCRMNTNWNT